MKANLRALTLVEAIFLIVIALILAGLILPALIPAREESRLADCRSNLKELGDAMAAYRGDNGGYFPFSWQRAGEAEPVGNGAANGAMAATSLGNLYPRYVRDAKLFKCPGTENSPSFVLNLPLECRNSSPSQTPIRTLPAGSNWTLTDIAPGIAGSYGYDPRISPRALPNLWVAADEDGHWGDDRSTMNHERGQNVLFADGHVKWANISSPGNYYRDRPRYEEEFLEDNWDADTDTYLLSKDAGLGISFDGYKHLHYPQKPAK